MRPSGSGWERQALEITVDLEHGGRWTSLRTPDREWLWSRPDPGRDMVRRGDAFVDAGGLEECFPTVRGTPDHGAVWSTPWNGEAGDACVSADRARLRRRLAIQGGCVVASYRLDGPAGYPFVHAAHALLDLSVEAHVDAPAHRVRITDDPRPLGVDVPWTGTPVEAEWPQPWGLPLHRMGSGDGTALGMILPDCAEVCVVDGAHALTWQTEGPLPRSVALWRNLGGFPPDRPYRSIGVEPLVGATFDRSEPGYAATIPPNGTVSWTIRGEAWRKAS